ncbi:MAG: Hsp33 family molecular chaperone HslO [Candidatus Eiseniibacteriota bacterium]|jgi:molecular chaperone Hsp33
MLSDADETRPPEEPPRGPDDAADDQSADRVGEVTVHRQIDHHHDVLIARADFTQLMAAFEDHVRRWEYAVDGLSMVLLRQAFGAATLHLSWRPPGEIVGWTINIQNPPTNVFITGDSGQRTVTGRAFTRDVKTSDSSRMFVQVSRGGEDPIQSAVNVSGLDVLAMFDQYYAISEQTPARFFELSDLEFMMVLGLPEVDEDWFRSLTHRTVTDASIWNLRSLGENTYLFRCGCNPDRMTETIVELYEHDPEQLFLGDPQVEVLCPRCGRRWWVERETFDAVRSARADREPDDDDGERRG